MKILTVLAATLVAAAVTIPAVAGERADTGFVSCLRSEGLDIPAATSGVEIKQWALRHAGDPAVERAFAACKPKGESPERLVECLREQGLEPPAAIEQLKPWIGRQLGNDAAKAALGECGMDPATKGKPGCGGGTEPEDEAARRQ